MVFIYKLLDKIKENKIKKTQKRISKIKKDNKDIYISKGLLKKKVQKESCCGDEDNSKIVKKQREVHNDGHDNDQNNHEEHSDDDGHDHDHSSEGKSTFQMFLPAIISFVLLLVAIGFDNYFTQSWFTGWVRIAWYLVAYIPVGVPVVKMFCASTPPLETYRQA